MRTTTYDSFFTWGTLSGVWGNGTGRYYAGWESFVSTPSLGFLILSARKGGTDPSKVLYTPPMFFNFDYIFAPLVFLLLLFQFFLLFFTSAFS